MPLRTVTIPQEVGSVEQAPEGCTFAVIHNGSNRVLEFNTGPLGLNDLEDKDPEKTEVLVCNAKVVWEGTGKYDPDDYTFEFTDSVNFEGNVKLEPQPGRQEQIEDQEKRADFLENGPDRLTDTESNVDDITLMLAEMIGGF